MHPNLITYLEELLYPLLQKINTLKGKIEYTPIPCAVVVMCRIFA